MGQEFSFLFFSAKEYDRTAADGLVGRDQNRRRPAAATYAFKDTVITRNTEAASAVFSGNYHSHHAHIE
jgi:hypothetical protein